MKSNILNYRRSQELEGIELMNANFKSNNASLHYHSEFIVGVMESGVQVYCPKAPKDKFISAGQISMINPERLHCNKSIDNKGYNYKTFNIQTNILNEIANDIAQNECSIPKFDNLTVIDVELEKRLFYLHDCLFFNELDTIQQQNYFYETIAYLIKSYSSDKPKEILNISNRKIVNLIKDYLHTHYASKITLKQLSEVSGMSSYYLNRIFSKSIGIPPHKYLINLRINKAQELLKKKYSATEVGYMAGFFDQSHFIKNFKLFLGITPKAYQAAFSK